MNPIDSVFRLVDAGPPVGPHRARVASAFPTLPDPDTGRPLAVAAIDVSECSVCPRCTSSGRGAYVSFVSDLRLAFACPRCLQVTWISGA